MHSLQAKLFLINQQSETWSYCGYAQTMSASWDWASERDSAATMPSSELNAATKNTEGTESITNWLMKVSDLSLVDWLWAVELLTTNNVPNCQTEAVFTVIVSLSSCLWMNESRYWRIHVLHTCLCPYNTCVRCLLKSTTNVNRTVHQFLIDSVCAQQQPRLTDKRR